MKKTLKTILFILAACVLAIASKMLLPSEVNAEDFNSLLVLKFGFPIVATSYFVMIYTHNAVVTKWFSKNVRLSNLSCALLLCLCIALFVVDKKDGPSCEKINSADFRAVLRQVFWQSVYAGLDLIFLSLLFTKILFQTF